MQASELSSLTFVASNVDEDWDALRAGTESELGENKDGDGCRVGRAETVEGSWT